MKKYRLVKNGTKTRWRNDITSDEKMKEYIEVMEFMGFTVEIKKEPTIYSVKYFDMKKGAWCKRGIQVIAETRKEAYEKATEILYKRGHTEKSFLMNCCVV